MPCLLEACVTKMLPASGEFPSVVNLNVGSPPPSDMCGDHSGTGSKHCQTHSGYQQPKNISIL